MLKNLPASESRLGACFIHEEGSSPGVSRQFHLCKKHSSLEIFRLSYYDDPPDKTLTIRLQSARFGAAEPIASPAPKKYSSVYPAIRIYLHCVK